METFEDALQAARQQQSSEPNFAHGQNLRAALAGLWALEGSAAVILTVEAVTDATNHNLGGVVQHIAQAACGLWSSYWAQNECDRRVGEINPAWKYLGFSRTSQHTSSPEE